VERLKKYFERGKEINETYFEIKSKLGGKKKKEESRKKKEERRK